MTRTTFTLLLLVLPLVAFIVVAPPAVHAQGEPPQSETPAATSPTAGLTVDEAVRRALLRAPAVEVAARKIATARARRRQSRSAFLPRVTLEASYVFNWPKAALPISLPPGFPAVAEIDDYHHVDARLSAGWRLLDLARSSRVDAAGRSIEAERAQAQDQTARVALAVRATFLSALFARDLRDISRQSVTQARREEKRAQLRKTAGAGNDVDLARARVRRAELEAQEQRADIELARARGELASLLGVGAAALPALAGELERLGATPLPAVRAPANPRLQALRAGSRAADALAKTEGRGFWPTIDLFANVGLLYPRALQRELGPVAQAGLRLRWDLFDGLQRSGKVAEAQARAARLRAERRTAQEAIERQLVTLQARARSAQADLLAARRVLTESATYLRVAKAAVATGAGTTLEVHTAELGVDRARIAVERALLAGALVRAELLYLAGRGAGRSALASAAGAQR